MKRALCLGIALGAYLCHLTIERVSGQGIGPGEQGAVLKNPFMDSMPASRPPNSNNTYVEKMWDSKAAPPANQHTSISRSQPAEQHGSPRPLSDIGLTLPELGPDPNQDIAVTEQHGPWMISIASYMGPEAPRMARTLAIELQNQHRLQAYVFSRGREERKKEYERVKKLLEDQREFYRQNNLPIPSNLRVRYRNVQEQCAVLVNSYATLDAARRDLERIRKLAPPDPGRVQLDKQYYVTKDAKTGKTKGEHVYVNPLKQAFVVHNPALKQHDGADPKLDITLLRRLNRSEEFNLLDCKKPYTLAIKQFFTPTTMHPINMKGSTFMEKLTMGGEDGERVDVAAQNAHNMAEVFRKNANLDAYVLHTQYSSIVTVGSFDSVDDPRMESIRNTLTTQLGVPQAIPMKVPQ